MENKEMFSRFIEDLKHQIKEKTSVWDQERTKYLKDYSNKRKLILQELSQFDYKDPLDTIDRNYLIEKYSSSLLFNELKDLSNTLSEGAKSYMIDRCENKERIMKIIEYYLNFVIEKNFDYLSEYLFSLFYIYCS